MTSNLHTEDEYEFQRLTAEDAEVWDNLHFTEHTEDFLIPPAVPMRTGENALVKDFLRDLGRRGGEGSASSV